MNEMITWPGGEWKTIRVIGKGGFGAVYEIQREAFGKVYKAAMKVMRIPREDFEIESMMDEGMTREEISQYYTDYVKRISEEFALLAELKGYTNIVSYEDHKILRNPTGFGYTILIRMELLVPVKQYFSEHRCNEETIIRLGTDICRALEICHERNIIHRDIKLDNIFVNERGDFELGDFGIARMTEQTMATMTVTGTPGYMAPEVYRKHRYGRNVDIYSLGIAMYMLMNRMRGPFYPLDRRITPDDRERALNARISGAPIPSPMYGSERLKRVVLKAIAFDPSERFQSAEEFRIALSTDVKADPYEEAYQKALNMESAAKTASDFLQTEAAYRQLGEYKDCRQRSVRCFKEAERLGFANRPNTLPEVPQVVNVTGKPKSRKRWIYGAAAILVPLLAGGIFIGISQMQKGDSPEEPAAVEVIPTEVPEETPIPEETEVPEPTEAPEPAVLPIGDLSKAEIGDRVIFGKYEQDHNLNNESEELKWIVLGKEEGKVLLLSESVLDAKPYNERETEVVWESCSIRGWLNGEFLNTAFSEEEEKQIIETHLINEDTEGIYWKTIGNIPYIMEPENRDLETEAFCSVGGNETDDKVFCLSISEAKSYLTEEGFGIGNLTVHAILERDPDRYNGAGWWWLRSPGAYGYFAACVRPDGSLLESGRTVKAAGVGVRPAIWVDLES